MKHMVDLLVSRYGADERMRDAFGFDVADEVLESAAGDHRERACSQCGGTCNSSCSYSTR